MIKEKEVKKEEAVPVQLLDPIAEKKAEGADRLKKLIAEETRLVKGRFRCFETPGAAQTVCCKKYKNVPMFKKEMVDGGTYEIPLFVARFLNGIDAVARDVNGEVGSCSYPIHGFKWDKSGSVPTSALGSGPGGEMGIPVPLIGVAKRVRRYGFESLEFGIS